MLSVVKTHATLAISGGPVGSVTATCSGAEDNAGNMQTASSVTYRVVFAWSGFFQPVDKLRTEQRKTGTTVPVKFNLVATGPELLQTATPD